MIDVWNVEQKMIKNVHMMKMMKFVLFYMERDFKYSFIYGFNVKWLSYCPSSHETIRKINR